MTLHRRLSLLLTAFLAVSALLHASTAHRRPLRNPEARRPASRAPSPASALLPGDEFMVDTTIAYQPWSGENPAVAYGSSEYLVVWQHDDAIHGARVTASGKLLDPSGTEVAPAGSGCFPAVAFDGANFLVIWRTVDLRIHGARVSPSGVVLDPNAIPVCSLSVCQSRPAVASGDTSCLVVWTDGRNGATTDIYGARVSRSGMVLDPGGIPIARDSGNQDEPVVTFDGSEHLVVWRDAGHDSAGDICGARVNAAGVVLDSLAIPISCAASAQAEPAVSFGDSVFLVAWDDSSSGSSRDIFCARLSPAGQVLDTNRIVVSTSDSGQTNPAVVFDGTDFLLSWTDCRNGNRSSDIYGARVSQTGIVLDTLGFPVCTAANVQMMPALARGDTLCLAAWSDQRFSGVPAIFGARISRNGQVLDSDGFVVSTTVDGFQYTPCAAFESGSYVVAWEQRSSPCFSRLASDGSLLDSAPRALCSPCWPMGCGPAVAPGESSALVVWPDWNANGVAGARVTPSGVVLDSGGIGIMNGGGVPNLVSVAGDGRNWLVVWDELSDSGTEYDIRAARVSSAGAVLDTSGIVVCGLAGEDHSNEQAASGDSGYLVVWDDNRFGWACIFAGRVTRTGAVLDSNGIQVNFDSARRDFPHVAFGDNGYLVVWQERTSSWPARYEICGARLDPDGAVVDSEPILIASRDYDCLSPSVAFDGTDYIVAWQNSQHWSITGARVSRWGTVLDTFPISRRYVSQSEFCLASGQNRQVLALCAAYTDSVNHRFVDCYRIWGRLSPFEAIEEDPTQVASRMTLDVLPNPLSGNSEVRYSLPVGSHVRLGVYDVSGRLVRLLADDEQKAGSHVLRWDGVDENRRRLPNGVCFVRLETAGRCESRVVIIAH